ncbi:hypothetical protein W59_39059 [Rhodococcus opacus RKJ300 = JCM 13270]|uniref:AsnC family transcriptional regulator n=2 Tax=Nocardiaceae TaxID=85025 RepID=I0W615_RHOOP|nr:hypothetical protein W59_39059 [Rhodococcus opacus RKJ300 = JCM 13270]QQZ14824.1 Lrp/AsnC family transcriptional regulator [Rhodococcus sp. 21391]
MMQNEAVLDEIDYQIAHALQIAPRAPWGAVSEALQVSPVTASRRWDRLVQDGVAWVIAYPGPSLLNAQCSAFVDVTCEPTHREHVTTLLTTVPQVASIQVVAGEQDLFLTVMVADLRALSEWIRNDLSRVDGVRGIRTKIVTRIYGESVRWRLGSLSPMQQHVLSPYVPDTGTMTRPPRADEQRLMTALAPDGRRSAVELAEQIGVSAPTVRKRLDRLVSEGILSVRCEVAHVLNGWPVTATIWARVPAECLDTVGRDLVEYPEVRVCCGVTGRSNLVLTVWLRHVGDLQLFETRLEKEQPELSVVEREVTLETVKRLGALLDTGGRRVGTVPIEP